MAVNKFIQYSLFIFNFLFWLIGCIILGVSVHIKNDSTTQILGKSIPGVDLLIAIGAVIMVLGFLGCSGAVLESRCMLLLFFIGLLLIFILLQAAGFLGLFVLPKVEEMMVTFFRKQSEQGPLDTRSAAYKKVLDFLQEKGQCCGLMVGPQDWGSQVPDTCKCTNTSAPCNTVGGKNVYTMPCATYMINMIKKSAMTIAAIAFVIGEVMLIGMGFTMTLYFQIDHRNIIGTS